MKSNLPKGVQRLPAKKKPRFRANIHWDGKLVALGIFDTVNEASHAFVVAQSARSDIKDAGHGFDWGCVWKKEKARRYNHARYHDMSHEERHAKYIQYEGNRQKKHEEDPQAYREYRDRKNNWKNAKKASDPCFGAIENMRARLSNIVKKRDRHNNDGIMDFLGCTTDQLASHLQSQFTTLMTWENYGTYWHVDHIMPVAVFDHAVESQVKQCWHYLNLQPLEAIENMQKSDQITAPQMQLLLGEH